MKSIATAAFCALFALAAGSGSGAPVPDTPAPEPAAEKDCPLCKLPGRAALFAGNARACPEDCAKLCCTGTEITFAVDGLTCDRCSSKVKKALAALEGVEVVSVSHEAGRAVLKYDPAKRKPGELRRAISSAGYKVSAEVASFRISGLKDEAAAVAVETALRALRGVRRIETVCHNSGKAVVTFDPDKTNREKITAAINTTRFKVAEEG